MVFSQSEPEKELRDRWRLKIQNADRHNILCHCRNCGEEWVTSTRNASCKCGSQDLEYIACWQFPDG